MSTKLLTVLALVAAICVVGLLVVQYLELTYYSAAPSLWP